MVVYWNGGEGGGGEEEELGRRMPASEGMYQYDSDDKRGAWGW